MTIKEKSFIFMARSRMLDVKCNFKIGKNNLLCRKCEVEDEFQNHLLNCEALKDNSLVKSDYTPSYEDLFSAETKKIEIIGKILMFKFKLLTNDNLMCTLNANYVGAAFVSQTKDLE